MLDLMFVYKNRLSLPFFSKKRNLIFFLFCFLISIPILFINPAHSEVNDTFTVRNISVDVTSNSSFVARDLAINQGMRVAFQTLLKRLTIEADYERLPDMSDEKIESFLIGFEVEEEKLSNVRYIGLLTFRFKDSPIRDLLTMNDLNFSESLAKPFLVIPVYKISGVFYLWEKDNPWKNAWDNFSEKVSLTKFVSAKGGFLDFSEIGPVQALSGDEERILSIAKKYQTDQAIVAFASLKPESLQENVSLEVKLAHYSIGHAEDLSATLSFDLDQGENMDSLFSRAAKLSAEKIINDWKYVNLIRNTGKENTLSVSVNVSGLDDWISILTKIQRISLVRELGINSLNPNKIEFTIDYVGSASQLRLAFSQNDLDLHEKDDTWFLEKTESNTQLTN